MARSPPQIRIGQQRQRHETYPKTDKEMNETYPHSRVCVIDCVIDSLFGEGPYVHYAYAQLVI